MKEDKSDNKIELTVRQGGNQVYLIENIHHKIKHVQKNALKKLKEEHGFDPPPNSVISLRYGSTDLTDLDKSLEDYGIPDKAVLDLIVQTGAG